MVAATLEIAKKEVAEGLILHSDQGTPYTSSVYNNIAKDYGITPSMSRVGTPLDKAPIESFFGTLKCECLYRHKPRDFEHAKELIDDYIYFLQLYKVAVQVDDDTLRKENGALGMLMDQTEKIGVSTLCKTKKCNIIHKIEYSSVIAILPNIYHSFMVLMFIYASQMGAVQRYLSCGFTPVLL